MTPTMIHPHGLQLPGPPLQFYPLVRLELHNNQQQARVQQQRLADMHAQQQQQHGALLQQLQQALALAQLGGTSAQHQRVILQQLFDLQATLAPVLMSTGAAIWALDGAAATLAQLPLEQGRLVLAQQSALAAQQTSQAKELQPLAHAAGTLLHELYAQCQELVAASAGAGNFGVGASADVGLSQDEVSLFLIVFLLHSLHKIHTYKRPTAGCC
jgi:hypothetical protein